MHISDNMRFSTKILGLIVFFCVNECFAANPYSATEEVHFEALKGGGFRAYIPDRSNVSKYKLRVRINKAPEISGQVKAATNGFWIIDFNTSVKSGDTVKYTSDVVAARLRYMTDEKIWNVEDSDIRDTYSIIDACKFSSTIVNGDKKCLGELIILDEFDEASVNIGKWTVEKRIPTYRGINLELNSYENTDTTLFTKGGVLHLKPIPRMTDEEVRGTLNLTVGCTSTDPKQCSYKQLGAFLLPPVKSARITSKVSFKYGRIEIKAKLPAGDWIVPVLQLQSQNNNNPSFSSKIFIAYSRGNDNLIGAQGIDMGGRILYAGPVLSAKLPEDNQKLFKRSDVSNKPYNSDYHIYTLQWLPDKLLFYIDSQLYGTIQSPEDLSAFDKELRLSLGVAVGGDYDFPDNSVSGTDPKPWSTTNRDYVKSFFNARNIWSKTWKGDDCALRVEYVKVWAV